MKFTKIITIVSLLLTSLTLVNCSEIESLENNELQKVEEGNVQGIGGKEIHEDDI